MAVESYNLIFTHQTDKAICCFVGHINSTTIWLPKSQIEVDGVSVESDFDDLVREEELDIYIPDWLAEEKGLI